MTVLDSSQGTVTSGVAIDNRSVSESYIHDLSNLMSRPTLMGTLKLEPTTDASTSLPLSYDAATYESYIDGTKPIGLIDNYEFPKSLFYHNPVVSDKAANFSFMKADVILTIKVNASPFTSGAINIAYTPMWRELVNIYKYSNITLPGVTSYPNTTLYLDQSDTVTMRIPFFSPYDMFSLQSPDFQFGQLVVTLLSPIRNGDGTSVDINVFSNFENVELKVPIDKSISTFEKQPLVESITAMKRAKYDVDENKDIEIDIDTLIQDKSFKDTFTAIAKRLKLVAQSGEPETQSPGVVERISNVVGDVSEALTEVPIVGTFAKPVSWIARAAGKVASWFGWSKPTILEVTKPVNRVPGNGMLYGEGVETNQNLGMIPDNGIIPHGALFEKQDEMTLDYVLSRPNVVKRVNWNSSHTHGQLIDSIVVTPKVMPDDDTPVQMGTFDYVCNLFGKWRGSINYTFTFVKTKFHAGRVALVYTQGTPPSDLGTLLSTNYNLIVDLNEITSTDGTNAQVSVEIPYLLNRPYADISTDHFRPQIAMYALNPLKQPSGCSDNIEILIWKSKGSDFELAMPIGNMSLAHWAGTKLVAQSGFESDVETKRYSLVPSTPLQDSLMQSVCAIGEKVETLRTLIKRFSHFVVRGTIMSSYPETKAGRMSMRDAVSLIYRFHYGGMRYKYQLAPNDVAAFRYKNTNATNKSGIGTANDDNWSAEAVVSGHVNNLAEIEIPFYSDTRVRTNAVLSTASDRVNNLNTAIQIRRCGRVGGNIVIPAGDTVSINTSGFIIIPHETFAKANTNGASFSSLTGYALAPETPIDNELAQVQFNRQSSDTETYEYFQCSVHPVSTYEAAADTAGFTFLVAPPCVMRAR
ncbi:hypothetical protein 2 [Wenling crustacean virus 2]|uniref:hypothetical protein 2 n=1 Tax=Wenling crustacean virus 2 TaxID=1923485 RepID=UPI00090C77E1|nr:hypothetical protein 2 [Wenling crustacean virus 2]APG78484.1 hypothetical protein 2 [Wenling crustacean virus 2]